MNKNKDTIAKLRMSNKKLHQELAVAKGQAGDEEVILSAFNASSRNEVSLVRSGILSQVFLTQINFKHVKFVEISE